jgi:hypothetical protein
MEIFYYAIIVYCLKICNTVDDMEKYINLTPMVHDECIITLEKMMEQEKKLHPRIANRNIGRLCINQDMLTDEDIAKYEVWGEAT